MRGRGACRVDGMESQKWRHIVREKHIVGESLRSGCFKRIKLGLSFERRILRPAGTVSFLLLGFGRLRGGRQRGSVRGCQTQSFWRDPPCTPPGRPRWGFPVSVIPRGLRGGCSGSFLASLGDLPARRAMPTCAFALNERPGGVVPTVWSLGNGRMPAEVEDLSFVSVLCVASKHDVGLGVAQSKRTFTQVMHSILCRLSGRERIGAGGGVIKNRSRHVGEVRA